MDEKRVALVTGGGGGLGKAIGHALAQDGLRVVLCDLDLAIVEAAARELPGEGHVGLRLDVADESSVVAAFEAAERQSGSVSVLVSCAGIQRQRQSAGFGAAGRQASPLPTSGTELSDWNKTLAVNATGCFLTAREYIRRLPEACRNGRIVTFSSVAARYGSIMSGIDYVATKAAIIGMTKTLASELASRGVTANCIAPGLIDTPMFRTSVKPEDDAKVSQAVPLGYIGDPQDIAAAVRFLVSDAAHYITGVTLDVNGGLRME
jgi:NAD(P)-dependent dehydrogenase (short-subunit alcohol dehydrogenase family)